MGGEKIVWGSLRAVGRKVTRRNTPAALGVVEERSGVETAGGRRRSLLTEVSSTTGGVLVVTPSSTSTTGAALNFPAPQEMSNQFTATLNASGQLYLYNNSTTATPVNLDVNGYSTAGAGNPYTAVTPARLADTRAGSGYQVIAPAAAQVSREVTVALSSAGKVTVSPTLRSIPTPAPSTMLAAGVAGAVTGSSWPPRASWSPGPTGPPPLAAGSTTSPTAQPAPKASSTCRNARESSRGHPISNGRMTKRTFEGEPGALPHHHRKDVLTY
jgi:hypothetical protein